MRTLSKGLAVLILSAWALSFVGGALAATWVSFSVPGTSTTGSGASYQLTSSILGYTNCYSTTTCRRIHNFFYEDPDDPDNWFFHWHAANFNLSHSESFVTPVKGEHRIRHNWPSGPWSAWYFTNDL